MVVFEWVLLKVFCGAHWNSCLNKNSHSNPGMYPPFLKIFHTKSHAVATADNTGELRFQQLKRHQLCQQGGLSLKLRYRASLKDPVSLWPPLQRYRWLDLCTSAIFSKSCSWNWSKPQAKWSLDRRGDVQPYLEKPTSRSCLSRRRSGKWVWKY